jgi:hypothetical protein
VRRDVLAGFEPKRFVVERDGDLVRFEGQVIAYPGDLGPGVDVGPGCAGDAVDVVVAGEALVRAERLVVDRREGGLVDVAAGYVPAGCEAGLVQDQGVLGVSHDPVSDTDDEMA